jgi:hypothetical protein
MSPVGEYDLKITDSEEVSFGYALDWGYSQPYKIDSKGPDIPINPSTQMVQGALSYSVRDVNDYFRIEQSDWSGGSAQKTLDAEDSLAGKFYASSNINTSVPGEIRLGPAVLANVTPNSYAASRIAPYCVSALGYCFAAFDPDTGDPRGSIMYSSDNVTWTPVLFNGTDPTGNVVAFATDGDLVYASFDSGEVWAGRATGTANKWTKFSSESGIKKLAFSGGYLYGAKGNEAGGDTAGTKAEVGWFDYTTGVWTTVSSDILHAAGPVELVSVGTHVYFVTQAGERTDVYKISVTDSIEYVGTFPSGFVALCACGYLGNLYIGGYYATPTSGVGIGALYLMNDNDQSILTTIGEDNTQDNRITGIAASGKNLYFISGSSIYRWSLEHGGYSHYHNITTGATGTVETWDVTEAMNAEPASGWTATHTDDHFTVSQPAAGTTKWLQDASIVSTSETFYPVSGIGYVSSGNDVYATARAGSNKGVSTSIMRVGQHRQSGTPYYNCYEAFIGFDTSSIPDGATITGATLSIAFTTNETAQDFTIRCFAKDWGATVDTGDFTAGASLPAAGAATLLATLGTGGVVINNYYDMASESGITTAISKTGNTLFCLYSDRQQLNHSPQLGTMERVLVDIATKVPKLTVSYTVPTAVPGTMTYARTDNVPSPSTGYSAEFAMAALPTISTAGTVYPFVVAINDATYQTMMNQELVSDGSVLSQRFGLRDSTGAIVYSPSYSVSATDVIRLTSKSGSQRVYLNNSLILGPVVAKADATTATWKVVIGDATLNTYYWSTTFDYWKFTNDNAFPAGYSSSPSAGFCWTKDAGWFVANNTGVYKTTSTYQTSGYVEQSRSAARMPSVYKFIRAIDVVHDVLYTGDTIKVELKTDGCPAWTEIFLDGTTNATLTASAAGTDTTHSWVVNQSVQNIAIKVTLGGSGSHTPIVRGNAIKFIPFNSRRLHTFVLSVQDETNMRNGNTWDRDADDAIDFLLDLADSSEVCTFETFYGANFHGHIETAAYVGMDSEMPTKQGTVQIEVREMT